MAWDYLAILHGNEIDWILWLQGFEWLEYPMIFFTLAGSQVFLLLIFLAIYWSYDVKVGYEFGLVLLILGCSNTLAKSAFHLPRPYWIDLRVRTIFHEESFGMPSGHAQITIATFGLIGVILRRKKVWLFLFLLIFMIGLSRIYLGVHFMSDVLVGWWLGGFLFVLLLLMAPGIRDRYSGKPIIAFILLALWLGLGFLLSGVLIFELISSAGWEVPVDWIKNALIAFPNRPPIDPLSLETISIAAGALVGFAGGGWWLIRRVNYQARGSLIQQLAKYLIGIGGIGVIYMLGSLVPVENGSWIAIFSSFSQFILVGVWISALAPLLFIQLKLSRAASRT